MARYNQYLNMSSGEILSLETDDADSYYLDGYDSISLIQKEIQMNFTAPRFRIFVLYPDESINYEIPTEDIKTGGVMTRIIKTGKEELCLSRYIITLENILQILTTSGLEQD